MKIKVLVLGMVQTNTYLVYNESDGRGFLVDPADRPDLIMDAVQKNGIKPEAILLTHGHFDHMLAASELRKSYRIPVICGFHEQDLLANAEANLSGSWASPCTLEADITVRDKEVRNIGGFMVTVLETPGHTTGSVCYYLEQEQALFAGDTLFAESIGNTQLPTGSGMQMAASLNRLIEDLPKETEVFPGHGDTTTIGHEKIYNPYIARSLS